MTAFITAILTLTILAHAIYFGVAFLFPKTGEHYVQLFQRYRVKRKISTDDVK